MPPCRSDGRMWSLYAGPVVTQCDTLILVMAVEGALPSVNANEPAATTRSTRSARTLAANVCDQIAVAIGIDVTVTC